MLRSAQTPQYMCAEAGGGSRSAVQQLVPQHRGLERGSDADRHAAAVDGILGKAAGASLC